MAKRGRGISGATPHIHVVRTDKRGMDGDAKTRTRRGTVQLPLCSTASEI